MLIVAGNSIHSIISSDSSSSIDIFTIQFLTVLSTVMRPGTIFPVVWLSRCHVSRTVTVTHRSISHEQDTTHRTMTLQSPKSSPHPLATGHIHNNLFIHDNLK